MNEAPTAMPKMPDKMGSFVDSTPLLHDGDALRSRATADGYLFFKSLLPREPVLELRRQMLAAMDEVGWRGAGQDSLGGRLDFDAMSKVTDAEMHRTDIGVPASVYHDVQRLEAFHRLPHHPKLLQLYCTLFGREVLVHPRHIGRMITSHPAISPTPPHQDFPLIQGTGNTWTCWMPMGDCPRAMGGLAVLRGSHRSGYLPIQPAKGAGGIAVQLCPGEIEWLTTDYVAGDVLTFTSYTVHRGVKSQLREQVRLSLDVRYQPIDEVVEGGSLRPHCELTWEEIYAGWKSEDLKYYWRESPLKMSEWDTSLLQPKRRIC